MDWSLSLAEIALYASGLLIPIFTVLGLASAVAAVMYTRTSQGAIAWAISLILAPLLAVPLYWLFGRRRFQGYVSAHRAKRDALRELAERVRARMTDVRASQERLPEDHRAFEKLTSLPFTRGNRLELLIDGEATFDSIFEAIAAAREYVLVEFFIMRDDELGMRLANLLVERAKAGVRCAVVFDGIGSRQLGSAYIRKLREGGVAVQSFSTTKGIHQIFQLNFRNHRKIVVVDGRVGFLGGLNVGDEYLGRDPKNSPWRDTHVRIVGPTVASLQMSFMEDWNWAAPEVPLELNWNAPPEDPANMTALIVPSGPADELETCALMHVQAIDSADQRVWIATPYFVPDPPAITALQLAALRGVDVRILIPDSSDSRLADWAGCTFFHDLQPLGVQFYRYKSGFLHEKVMLIDDSLAAVGTANFDNRSFRLNFEITALCSDPVFVAAVERMLTNDFAKSLRAEPREWEQWSFLFELRARLARLTATVQ